MKSKSFISRITLFCCALLAATGISRAQVSATLTDLSTNAPVPGPNDQYQVALFGTGKPGGLNYYWDNGNPNGQTFTTGSNPNGYVLTSVAVQTAGGGGSDGSPSGSWNYAQPFYLRIYSVSGAATNAATLLTFYQSQVFSLGAQSNWVQMTGLSTALLPNSVYAYTFSRSTSGYENLSTAAGNPYPGGAICEIPPNGGTVNYGTAGTSTNYDATFDVGLSTASALTVNQPSSSSPNPVTQGTVVTLSTIAVGPGAITYQWQTDGGSGGAITNIPGATNATLSVNTTLLPLTNSTYTVVASNSISGSVTSGPTALDVIYVATGTLTDLMTSGAITAGGYDIYQFTSPLNGGTYNNDGINEYTDAGINNNPAYDGNTFTTGSNAKGYYINSLAILLAGGGSGGNIANVTNNYDLFLYSVNINDNTATLVAHINNTGFGISTYPDWIKWGFTNIFLNPNTTYAYTFGRGSAVVSYAGISCVSSSSGLSFTGGSACAISSSGGAINYGSLGNGGADETFDIGLVPLGLTAPIPSVPAATPNPVYALSPVTLSDMASGPIGSGYIYQWLTDDGSGATPPNYITLTGVTGSNATVVPQNLYPGGSDYSTNYYVKVSNGSSSSTSAVVTVTVHPASIPQFTTTPTPTNLVTFAGQASFTYSTASIGTIPITNQWQSTNTTSGGFTNLAGQTNATLTLTNLQIAQSGAYQIVASNVVGSSNAPFTISVLADPPAPTASQAFPYAVSTNNPWAYWRLNETSDPTAPGAPTYSAYDYSGHGFDAAYGSGVTVNNPGPQPPAYPGFPANELAAGTSYNAPGYLTVPNLNLGTASNVTFMAWINPASAQNASTGLLFNRGGPDGGAGFGYGNTSDMLGYTWNNNSAATYNFSSGLMVQDGQWNFVAYVITPSNATIYLGYVQGGVTNFYQAVNPIPHTPETFSGGTLRLGSDAGSVNRTFNGLIDEVSLFTNALSTAQIQGYFLKAIGGTVLPPTVANAAASPATTVYSGQNVLLTVKASGSAPLTNNWQVSPDGVSWSNIAGATNTTYVLNPQIVGSFYYQFVSANAAGSKTSGSLAITFNALPSYPPGLWTANFQMTNNIADNGQNEGAGVGYYVGRGILGNGMYWNILPMTLVPGSAYGAATLNSVSDFRDDGVTHTGIYAQMNNGGGYNALAPGVSPLPNRSDIGNLLDQYYRTYYSPGALQFFGVPNGTYNLTVYGGDGYSSQGANNYGSTFVVHDTLNGNQTNSTAAPTPMPALQEFYNFVTFTNVHVSGGNLVVDVQANTNTTAAACVEGAQLQLVSYDSSISVSLTGTGSGTNLTLNWPEGILQTATNLSGPWTPINVRPPYTVPETNKASFYRLQIN